jgi:hypothetical protein
MTNKNLLLALISSVSLAAFSVVADDVDISKIPPASSQKNVTYEKDIRPIFEKNCFKCHGEEKQKGKLRLDSRDAVLKGSADDDIGQVIKKGDGAHSILVQSVARVGDPDDAMPPLKKGSPAKPLSAEQVSLIRAWVDQGAN